MFKKNKHCFIQDADGDTVPPPWLHLYMSVFLPQGSSCCVCDEFNHPGLVHEALCSMTSWIVHLSAYREITQDFNEVFLQDHTSQANKWQAMFLNICFLSTTSSLYPRLTKRENYNTGQTWTTPTWQASCENQNKYTWCVQQGLVGFIALLLPTK